MRARWGLWAAVLRTASALHFYLRGSQKTCFLQELSQGTLLVGRHPRERLTDRAVPGRGRLAVCGGPGAGRGGDPDKHTCREAKRGQGEGLRRAGGRRTRDRAVWIQDEPVHVYGRPDSRARGVFRDPCAVPGRAPCAKATESLDSMTQRAKSLNQQLYEIRLAQKMMRVGHAGRGADGQERETEFREQSEATNRRVLRWAVVQLGVLVAASVWQMQHLQGFGVWGVFAWPTDAGSLSSRSLSSGQPGVRRGRTHGGGGLAESRGVWAGSGREQIECICVQLERMPSIPVRRSRTALPCRSRAQCGRAREHPPTAALPEQRHGNRQGMRAQHAGGVLRRSWGARRRGVREARACMRQRSGRSMCSTRSRAQRQHSRARQSGWLAGQWGGGEHTHQADARDRKRGRRRGRDAAAQRLYAWGWRLYAQELPPVCVSGGDWAHTHRKADAPGAERARSFGCNGDHQCGRGAHECCADRERRHLRRDRDNKCSGRREVCAKKRRIRVYGVKDAGDGSKRQNTGYMRPIHAYMRGREGVGGCMRVGGNTEIGRQMEKKVENGQKKRFVGGKEGNARGNGQQIETDIEENTWATRTCFFRVFPAIFGHVDGCRAQHATETGKKSKRDTDRNTGRCGD
ncbi:hypothetical protein PMAC_002617 [Pneumocystis sp. 'macacae']|nr:hypothetical protein PMAC_002617 [Pneumocystis sp. 'macacae']